MKPLPKSCPGSGRVKPGRRCNCNMAATRKWLDATALDEFAALGMGKSFRNRAYQPMLTDARMALVRMRQAIVVADWEQWLS